MDLTPIPRSFWHALSISVVALTLGFIWLGSRSRTIDLEYGDLKVTLSQAAAEADAVNRGLGDRLAELERASADVERKSRELEEKAAEMKGVLERTPGISPETLKRLWEPADFRVRVNASALAGLRSDLSQNEKRIEGLKLRLRPQN